MVYVTGDCHANWQKFSNESFPEQKDMTRDDFVIICGDFGIWHNDETERWWFKWFEKKNPTFLFVDGNHENYDRLFGDEFDVIDFHGGKVHKICENVFHLIRGNIYELCGKKFFAFGGASSHDIKDGILEPSEYKTTKELVKDYNQRTQRGEMLRINHLSWWKEEMPSKKEMNFGIQQLKNANFKVDYVVSHCLPQVAASVCSNGFYKSDELTLYFNSLLDKGLDFEAWFCGHYHRNQKVLDNYYILYEQIIRVC